MGGLSVLFITLSHVKLTEIHPVTQLVKAKLDANGRYRQGPGNPGDNEAKAAISALGQKLTKLPR
jgi:hypothetical protein